MNPENPKVPDTAAIPEATSAEAAPATPEERSRLIAEAARRRTQARGFAGGDLAEDWRAAEAEVDAMLAARAPDAAAIGQEVESALAADPAQVAERVRGITLHALSRGGLNRAVLKEVTRAVIHGAREGASRHAQHAAQTLEEAIRGLAEHARNSGTAAGRRVKLALTQFTQSLAGTARDQVAASAQALRSEARLFAGLAAGLLQGIAERLLARGERPPERDC